MGVFKAGDVSVLLVSVCVPVSVATVESMAKVTVFPLAVLSSPVPPVNVSVSLSRSIAMVVDPSVISKSWAVTCASTYAFSDCCVTSFVAEFEDISSSSKTPVTVAPPLVNARL